MSRWILVPLLSLSGFACAPPPNTPTTTSTPTTVVTATPMPATTPDTAIPAKPESDPEPATESQPANSRVTTSSVSGKVVLIELFTAQGCDSCPAADAFVGELAALGLGRDKVLPLTYHVSYWDDLGWQDPFASQLYDQRQIGYAHAVPKARSADETTMAGPYTPQMVIDGRVHFSGALRDVARQEIEVARQRPPSIDLSLVANWHASETRIELQVDSRLRPGASLDTDRSKVGLFAALSQHVVETPVPHGENAGKTLTEYAVVRDFAGPQLFRSSRPQNETTFVLTPPTELAPGDASVVVFAQDLATLAILGAAEVTPARAG